MASNSKNLAELLNSDVTLTATDIANGAVTTDKLAADAVTTAKIASSVNLGRRNLIINGAMQCYQRGNYTITTSGSPEYGGTDRFHMWSYTSTEEVVGDVTQSTDVPSGQGFAYSRKFDVTTAESSVAAGEVLLIGQYIESQNLQHLEYGTNSAKDVTMSFWIKTTKAGTYCFFLQQDDGDRIYVKEYTVDASDTWEKKIITIPGDASGTLNNDNGRGLWCAWVLMAGTNRHGTANEWRATDADYATSNQVNAVDSTSNNIFLTGIQLEVGDTATPFEHHSYGEELALCQRYYQVISNALSDLIGVTVKWSAGNHFIFTDLPVEMRTQPTLDTNVSTLSAALRLQCAGYSATGNNLQLDGDSSSRRLRLNTTVDNASITNGYGGWIRTNNSSIYVNVDAEL